MYVAVQFDALTTVKDIKKYVFKTQDHAEEMVIQAMLHFEEAGCKRILLNEHDWQFCLLTIV